MLFLLFLVVMGYIRLVKFRRYDRFTLGTWLTTNLCRMFCAVVLYAGVVPIMCATLFLGMVHILVCCVYFVCQRIGGIGDQSVYTRAQRRALEKNGRKLRKRLRPYRWLLGRHFLWWLRIGRCATQFF